MKPKSTFCIVIWQSLDFTALKFGKNTLDLGKQQKNSGAIRITLRVLQLYLKPFKLNYTAQQNLKTVPVPLSFQTLTHTFCSLKRASWTNWLQPLTWWSNMDFLWHFKHVKWFKLKSLWSELWITMAKVL